ncbi:DUF1330 domain-containing protein [Oceanimonas sp. MB9]|uniref:DUF1330 domain-containing protein n=1 Tax=Oceanimonas sp. MB9 TaxID=2588453 RepID=UPI0013F5C2F0|nr:DUF1330 domain-containing protein [Oceanimonas sp. MB9]NHI00251.1 hypothetical protein [Oceanimonas sp. MB9]
MSLTYIYIQFSVRNPQAFQEYASRVGDTVTAYGGRTIAINREPTALHGETQADVCVIQQWPSLEAVRQWLNSPEYAPLKALRDEKAMSQLRIIPVPAV